MYFCSLFFFSNYILLNLFIAVILDNFAASMREQELDISEEDFEYFKYAFRLLATDKVPDVMPFKKLYGLMAEIADRQAHDDDGNDMENPMTPPIQVEWDSSAAIAWRISTPQGNEYENDENAEWIKPCVERFWNEECTPLKSGDGVDHIKEFDGEKGFWKVFMETPFRYEMTGGGGRCFDFPVNEEMAAYQAGQPHKVSLEQLEDGLKSWRFRLNFKKLLEELRFKNHVFVNEDSELQYDHLLQGLVCNKLGAAAVSLDEQRERGLLPQAGAEETIDLDDPSAVSFDNPVVEGFESPEGGGRDSFENEGNNNL